MIILNDYSQSAPFIFLLMSALGSLLKSGRITQRFEAKPPWTKILNIKEFIFLGPSLWETTTRYFLTTFRAILGKRRQVWTALWVTDQKKEPASHCAKLQFPQMKIIMLFFSQLKKRRYCTLVDSTLCFLWFPLSFSGLKTIVPPFKMSRGRKCKIL